MWNSVKEWRDDCRIQQQLNQTISQQCTEILKQELSPPPTWWSFVYKKIAKRFQPDYAYYKLEDDYFTCGGVKDGDPRCYQTHHDEDGTVGGSRFWATSEVVDFKSWDRRSVVEKGRIFRMAGSYKRKLGYHAIIPFDHGDDAPENQQLREPVSSDYKLRRPNYDYPPSKMLASRAPRKSLLEQRIDSMIERAECDTVCGTSLLHWRTHLSANEHSDSPSSRDYEVWYRGDAREGPGKQGDAAILYGGLENYTAYFEEMGSVRSRDLVQMARISPVREPGTWYANESKYMLAGEDIPPSSRGLWALFVEPAPKLDEEWGSDWGMWVEHLEWKYAEKITITQSGEGSHERMRVEFNEPAADVWRRGCYCQAPVPHTMISLGDLILFHGPTWMFWDLISTWTAVLMMFVYWEWMLGRDLRRRGDERRKRNGKKASPVKVKDD